MVSASIKVVDPLEEASSLNRFFLRPLMPRSYQCPNIESLFDDAQGSRFYTVWGEIKGISYNSKIQPVGLSSATMDYATITIKDETGELELLISEMRMTGINSYTQNDYWGKVKHSEIGDKVGSEGKFSNEDHALHVINFRNFDL